MTDRIEDVYITREVTPSLVITRLNPEVTDNDRAEILRQAKISQYLGFYGRQGADVLPILEDLI